MTQMHIMPYRQGEAVRTINFEYGQKSDPHIIGPDDNVAYEMRTPDEAKDTPNALLDVEVQHLLPIAKGIAKAIGINVLQECQYGNVLDQIRQRSVFVVLNVLAGKSNDGDIFTYSGLVIMCKKHPIVRVVCKCKVSTGAFGVSQVHTWHKNLAEASGGEYHVHGDMEGRKPMPTHTVLPLILEYLEAKEKVLTLV